ncbi:hypothetical protein J3459_013951 [Metarhizium acridum]|uniref:uncharacterized protein n=1 Tax=Metarhizium acridum TaxID=92637 RepID=UPI001C6D1E67|nr:hypothetical protein J3458_021034 [Metarhizium acridum]KAG8415890.1 hypothetical protein J3459_013951 [Metarhizium acridum]
MGSFLSIVFQVPPDSENTPFPTNSAAKIFVQKDMGPQSRPWAGFPDLPEEIGNDHVKKCQAVIEEHVDSYPNEAESYVFEALVDKRLRICILLHHLKAEDSINHLLRLNPTETPTDKDLPLQAHGEALKKIIQNPEQRSKFCDIQKRLFRRFDPGTHTCFKPRELPFKDIKHLGDGTFANVKAVEDVHTNKVYACKSPKDITSTALSKELRNLKSLGRHKHVVSFEGSFSKGDEICILLLPVADMNLDQYLRETDINVWKKPRIKKIFGCLSAGLAFLNKKGIRHKDIKPKNILVHKDEFLFTDFGSAYNFGKTGMAATSNTNPGAVTWEYAAPEALVKKGLRDIKTDLFSLGCIFAEVLTFLAEKGVQDLRTCVMTKNGIRYGENVLKLHEWLNKLKRESPKKDGLDLPIEWCKQMTQEDLTDRPMIHNLISGMIEDCENKGKYFCDDCLKAHTTLAPLKAPLPTVMEETSNGSTAGNQLQEGPNGGDNDYGIPSLSLAAMKGDEKAVQRLINNGADVEGTDPNECATALHYACQLGNQNVVKILLETGQADPNQIDPFVGSAVSWAAKEGEKELVEFLLRKGGQVTVTSKLGRTPLHQAAQKGHNDVVRLLLKWGATLTTDSQGRTPLHLAARHGKIAVVRLLLEEQPALDPEALDNEGLTPADLAAKWQHYDIVQLLTKTPLKSVARETTVPVREKPRSPKKVSFKLVNKI